MPAPTPTDADPGTDALVMHEGGLTLFRYEESTPDGEGAWREQREYDRDAIESVTLGGDGPTDPVLGEFSVGVDVDAPIDRVFAFVADIGTHPEYADFVERVTVTSDAQRGEDVTFVQFHEGSDERIESEFVTYDPPERVGWVTRKEAGDIDIDYRFTESEGGTRVRHTGVAPLSTDSPAAFDAGLRELTERYRNNEREMANLRAILE